MKASVAIGIVLVVVGVFALAYQGISYTKTEKVVDLGPLEVRTEDRERIPLPPLVGGATLALGAVLIVAGSRKGAARP